MALRIATRLPRLAIVGMVVLLASATLAVGAAKRMATVPQGAPAPVSAPTVIVPDVVGQAFVFAKGTLADTGFAWQVTGPVHGFAANKVAKQTPAPGTKLRDTGTPTITLVLERTAYPEKGEPEDVSPFVGTSVQPLGVRHPAVTPAPVPAAPTKGAAKPAPKTKKIATKRPPAFVVAGAPKEPLDEMPLTARAVALKKFIASHAKTKANVQHFLYQHSWIVTGAKFGWWRGADALHALIVADQAAQQRWGIGQKSELVARSALAEVEARMK